MADRDETSGGGEAVGSGGGGPTPQLNPHQLFYLIVSLKQAGLKWDAILALLANEYGGARVIVFMELAGLRDTSEKSEPLTGEMFVGLINEAHEWEKPNLFEAVCHLRDRAYSRSLIVAALRNFWKVDEIEAACDKANVTLFVDTEPAASETTILAAFGISVPEPDQSSDIGFEF